MATCKMRDTVIDTGRFSCVFCPHHGIAAFEYFLVLAGTVLVNAFLIWRLLDEKSTGWDQAEGSDYVEVCSQTHMLLAGRLSITDCSYVNACAFCSYIHQECPIDLLQVAINHIFPSQGLQEA